MSQPHGSSTTLSHRIPVRKVAVLSLIAAFVLFLVLLVATGETWRAIAYALVALFAVSFLLAVYFWGTVLLSGVLETFDRHQTTAAWSLSESGLKDIPEHSIDPGLELLAAGVLVYRVSEVKPHIHFRKIPLTNARALRPFVVARTGSERAYDFNFVLTDEWDVVRLGDEFAADLTDDPQIVMPPYRLSITLPKKLVGQRWNLQVRSGLTVVTSFRFAFVDSTESLGTMPSRQGGSDMDEPILDWQRDMLPRLLDEALKRDVMATTQEILLEGI